MLRQTLREIANSDMFLGHFCDEHIVILLVLIVKHTKS